MRGTPFYRILGIYCVALLFLLLWPVSTKPLSRSVKTAVLSLCRAFQIDDVFAEPLRHSESDSDLPVRDHETIQKLFSLPATHKSVGVDNVFGSIEVVGGPSDQVQLSVEKSIRAESKEALELARKEVTLDMAQQEGALKLYLNGPFRCRCDDCRGSRDHEGYVVRMDFRLHVPRDIDAEIKTVNEGRILVRNVSGNFLVRNVNGDIQMDNIGGSGSAHTVNGPVAVTFRENPRENSSFQSVNGNIDLFFARGLAANFRLKTFNGGVYSDFPVAALPAHAVQEDHRDGKTIFRADRFTEARIGSGGPEIKVENLNGDIRILENHE